ncbi:ComC/BlpC family leader-containing pheromone/bacteriocin [Streptococcus ovuberis]|uniref:ComC/BlpC family leader-containing pheromone/bacteriocin n=1 Tax=Streptococcus ovuberis TaxID=1936207 RepID=A0A7X6S0F7_9STRE|nr:ComC/BlpC family leader-containing pheromone/bacteriocin [Streptococcus ovuberis]NKZ20133.1 ComC/BlpC family leader-containing pheromone/bacteriocin [Streptococcus ovuberis]
MTKQTKSLTHFSELSSSELHRISGGDWWSDWMKLFPRPKQAIDSNNKHKLG